MKIIVIGATGMAGSQVAKEALKRGHNVVAIARSAEKLKALFPPQKQLTLLAKDVFQLTKHDFDTPDVIVDCFATAPEKAYLHVDLATKLVAMYRETEKPRLVFILGAGSLQTGRDLHLFVEDLRKMLGTSPLIQVPENQLKELKFLENVDDVNWVGISPSADFHAGPATPYLLGNDELLQNAEGKSETTSGTMAQVILNEIEDPQHHQERFTVCDQ